MTVDEAKRLHDDFEAQMNKSQNEDIQSAPPFHDNIVTSLSGYLKQNQKLDEIFTKNWPEILGLVPEIHLKTNNDVLVLYCYGYTISSSSAIISDCSSRIYDSMKRLNDLSTTTGTQSTEYTSITKGITWEREMIVELLIEAFENARNHVTGDIFPLILSEVKSRINQKHEIDEAVVEFVEEAQKLIKDDFEKMKQPTSTEILDLLKNDKLCHLMEIKAPTDVSKTKTA
ncbi:hypothetical protein RF11_01850 [Thelohanellus kitauei]|uniref:Uncharacterized protein n=1 Tax=Thelohanellus kitauei TaxID=669202 RepID=A0A0C2ICQ7_THEKT|nr:hypothetical protein RF11_01850 [Thelohanellus kitauei]